MPDQVHIYALSDPLDPGVFRYIGKTSRSLARRLSRHIFEARSGGTTHKCRWIMSMIRMGRRPLISLLETVADELWQAAEQRHIAAHCATLTNSTIGGDGCEGLSAEARDKISAALTGREIRPEWRRKLSEANRGKRLSDEHRRRVSEGGRGKTRSAETRERIAAAHRGTHLSEETKAKISRKAKERYAAIRCCADT